MQEDSLSLSNELLSELSTLVEDELKVKEA
jgi:hypothetical protein